MLAIASTLEKVPGHGCDTLQEDHGWCA
jgi:hypothetical protein